MKCVRLRYDSLSLGNQIPKFRGTLIRSASRIDILNDVITLPRNVGIRRRRQAAPFLIRTEPSGAQL